MVSVLVSDW